MGFFRRSKATTVVPVSPAALHIAELLTDAYDLWEKVTGTTFDLTIELPGYDITIREYNRCGEFIEVRVGKDDMILTKEDRQAINKALCSWEKWDRQKTIAENRKKADEAAGRIAERLQTVTYEILG